jgi:site-specific DNA-methyltransferase (adenine-specific)
VAYYEYKNIKTQRKMNKETNLQTPTQPQSVITDTSRYPSSIVYLEDCVQGLKRFADKHFDLAIIDPPYGNVAVFENCQPLERKNIRQKKYADKDWDKQKPPSEYWQELFRVSKNQIVWGGNYFTDYLPESRGWIYWDKNNGDNSFSDGELAWTSFNKRLMSYKKNSKAETRGGKDRFHPTQKPIGLYDFCIINYGAEANIILDTHVGSGSSRIAAAKAGKQFIGFEIDPEYYEKQEKRFKNFSAQQRLF